MRSRLVDSPSPTYVRMFSCLWVQGSLIFVNPEDRSPTTIHVQFPSSLASSPDRRISIRANATQTSNSTKHTHTHNTAVNLYPSSPPSFFLLDLRNRHRILRLDRRDRRDLRLGQARRRHRLLLAREDGRRHLERLEDALGRHRMRLHVRHDRRLERSPLRANVALLHRWGRRWRRWRRRRRRRRWRSLKQGGGGRSRGLLLLGACGLLLRRRLGTRRASGLLTGAGAAFVGAAFVGAAFAGAAVAAGLPLPRPSPPSPHP